MFFRNAWYVAALDAELKDKLLPVSCSMSDWPSTGRRTVNRPPWRTPVRIASSRCRWDESKATTSNADITA